MNHEQFRRQLSRTIRAQAETWAEKPSAQMRPDRRMARGRSICRARALRRLGKNVELGQQHTASTVSAERFHQTASDAARSLAADSLVQTVCRGGGADNRSPEKAEAFRQAHRQVLNMVKGI